MKKLFAMVLCIVMVFSLVACGQKTEDDSSVPTKTVTEKQTFESSETSDSSKTSETIDTTETENTKYLEVSVSCMSEKPTIGEQMSWLINVKNLSKYTIEDLRISNLSGCEQDFQTLTPITVEPGELVSLGVSRDITKEDAKLGQASGWVELTAVFAVNKDDTSMPKSVVERVDFDVKIEHTKETSIEHIEVDKATYYKTDFINELKPAGTMFYVIQSNEAQEQLLSILTGSNISIIETAVGKSIMFKNGEYIYFGHVSDGETEWYMSTIPEGEDPFEDPDPEFVNVIEENEKDKYEFEYIDSHIVDDVMCDIVKMSYVDNDTVDETFLTIYEDTHEVYRMEQTAIDDEQVVKVMIQFMTEDYAQELITKLNVPSVLKTVDYETAITNHALHLMTVMGMSMEELATD